MSSEKALKDLDHIFNITLKNNKSRESVIMFLRSFSRYVDEVIKETLEKLAKESKIDEVPNTPFERAKLFLLFFKDKDIERIIEEYLNVRMALLSDFDIYGEHRKSIKMIFHTAKGDIEYDMDKIKNLLQKAHYLDSFLKKKWENQ